MPIVRKKDSRFLWYDFRYGGRRYRGSTNETTKTAARAFEARLLAKLELEGELPTLGRRAPLLRDFLPKFIASVTANQQHAANTKRYYQNGARLLQDTPLRDIQLDRITRSSVAAVEFPGSGSNANNAIRTLRVCLSYAVELRLLHASPRLPLRKERVRDEVFQPEHEQAFLEHADQDAADFFIQLLDSGMRPGEVIRHEWDWTDWLRNVIRIPDGKTGAARRIVPMSTRLRETLIARMKRLQASPFKNHRAMKFVYPSKHKGKHISMGTVNDWFNAAKEAANLPPELVMYCTRHTFGTDLAELGNPKLTMITMGHTDLKTTARYQHPQTHKVASFIDQRNEQRKTVTTENGHSFGHSSELPN